MERDQILTAILSLVILGFVVYLAFGITSTSLTELKDVKQDVLDIINEAFGIEDAQTIEDKGLLAKLVYEGILEGFRCIEKGDICCEFSNMGAWDSKTYQITLVKYAPNNNYVLQLSKEGDVLLAEDINLEKIYYKENNKKIKEIENQAEFGFYESSLIWGDNHPYIDPDKDGKKKISWPAKDRFYSLYKSQDKVQIVLKENIKGMKDLCQTYNKKECYSEYDYLIKKTIEEIKGPEMALHCISPNFIKAILEENKLLEKNLDEDVIKGLINDLIASAKKIEKDVDCNTGSESFQKSIIAISIFGEKVINEAIEKAPPRVIPMSDGKSFFLDWEEVEKNIKGENENGEKYKEIIPKYVKSVSQKKELYNKDCQGGIYTTFVSEGECHGEYNQHIKEVLENEKVDSCLDLNFIKAIIKTETNFEKADLKDVVSKTGAVGRMQLVPTTAIQYGLQISFNEIPEEVNKRIKNIDPKGNIRQQYNSIMESKKDGDYWRPCGYEAYFDEKEEKMKLLKCSPCNSYSDSNLDYCDQTNDERFNENKNVEAGIKHLNYLAKLFKDKGIDDCEDLKKYVAASYNQGEGNLLNAIKKSGTTDWYKSLVKLDDPIKNAATSYVSKTENNYNFFLTSCNEEAGENLETEILYKGIFDKLKNGIWKKIQDKVLEEIKETTSLAYVGAGKKLQKTLNSIRCSDNICLVAQEKQTLDSEALINEIEEPKALENYNNILRALKCIESGETCCEFAFNDWDHMRYPIKLIYDFNQDCYFLELIHNQYKDASGTVAILEKNVIKKEKINLYDLYYTENKDGKEFQKIQLINYKGLDGVEFRIESSQLSLRHAWSYLTGKDFSKRPILVISHPNGGATEEKSYILAKKGSEENNYYSFYKYKNNLVFITYNSIELMKDFCPIYEPENKYDTSRCYESYSSFIQRELENSKGKENLDTSYLTVNLVKSILEKEGILEEDLNKKIISSKIESLIKIAKENSKYESIGEETKKKMLIVMDHFGESFVEVILPPEKTWDDYFDYTDEQKETFLWKVKFSPYIDKNGNKVPTYEYAKFVLGMERYKDYACSEQLTGLTGEGGLCHEDYNYAIKGYLNYIGSDECFDLNFVKTLLQIQTNFERPEINNFKLFELEKLIKSLREKGINDCENIRAITMGSLTENGLDVLTALNEGLYDGYPEFYQIVTYLPNKEIREKVTKEVKEMEDLYHFYSINCDNNELLKASEENLPLDLNYKIEIKEIKLKKLSTNRELHFIGLEPYEYDLFMKTSEDEKVPLFRSSIYKLYPISLYIPRNKILKEAKIETLFGEKISTNLILNDEDPKENIFNSNIVAVPEGILYLNLIGLKEYPLKLTLFFEDGTKEEIPIKIINSEPSENTICFFEYKGTSATNMYFCPEEGKRCSEYQYKEKPENFIDFEITENCESLCSSLSNPPHNICIKDLKTEVELIKPQQNL